VIIFSRKSKSKVSIIVPCYNAEKYLPRCIESLINQTNENIEILLVNDGSKDNTLEVIKSLAEKDDKVRFLSFSRNFGKEAAIYAGLSHNTGDYVAIMDADLQDPPSLLPEMIGYIIDEGYDCVAAKRNTRKGEPVFRSIFAKLFYKIFNKISDTGIVDGARDFRLMRRSVADAILQMPEYNRFSKGIYEWVGFKTKWITYGYIERVAGNTKWSVRKLYLYALNGIVAFSTVPLAIASVTGLILFFISIVAIIIVVLRTLIWGDPVAGWPAMICVILFVGGIQLFCFGIMGQYVAKSYMETKGRPIYLLREKNF